MPLARKTELFERVISAITTAGWNILYLPVQEQSCIRLQVYHESESFSLRVYIWNLTPGGRPALADEYRIQVTGIDHFVNEPPEITLILGWWDEQRVFAAFDYQRHSGMLGSSASIQIRRQALEEAHVHGFGIGRKDTEVVVAVRPEYFMQYIRSLRHIHDFGVTPEMPQALEHVLQDDRESSEEIALAPFERKEVLRTLRRRVRSTSFRERVLNAYSHTCVFCGIQLKLVEAAHILPVLIQGSPDEIYNGVALCALHHLAYDRSLIAFDESYHILINEPLIDELRKNDRIEGLSHFRENLHSLINLPPSKADRPHPDLIRRANILRWRL